MFKVTVFLLFAVVLFAKPKDETKHVLIYTRNEQGEGLYIHDNIETSVKTLGGICDRLGVGYEVSDDPTLFTSDKLQSFDVIIFSNTNNQAFTSQEQRDAFQSYIRTGGAFMGIHSSCASERQWPWFWAMTGGKFVRHPKLQPFDIKVIDRDHPSTQHLNDVWKWEDECYLMNHLNPDIHVLLAVDLTTIQDDQLDEYPGETFGNLFPLAWYHHYDGGHQFYTALGHKIEYYSDPDFVRHLQGGLEWLLEQ